MLNVHWRHWLIHLSQIENLEMLNVIESAKYVDILSYYSKLGATISILQKLEPCFIYFSVNFMKKDHEFPNILLIQTKIKCNVDN